MIIMLRKQNIRRPIAALLMILGAIMMFLAPEAWIGAILLVLGLSIELVGISMRKHPSHDQ
jgi:hypothetical protein